MPTEAIETDAIEAVRSVEQEADKILGAARQHAKQTIHSAQNDAADIIAQSAEKSHKDAEARISAAQKESRQSLDDAMAVLNEEMENLRSSVRAKQPQAVKAIIDALA